MHIHILNGGGLVHDELAHGELAHGDALMRGRQVHDDELVLGRLCGDVQMDDRLVQLQHARTLVGKCQLQELQLKLRTMSNEVKKKRLEINKISLNHTS